MTNEELLKPRFKVIDDYPNSLFKIDEILIGDERIYCDENSKRYSDFPNIFKPLEWWEERELTDFPKYLENLDFSYPIHKKVEEYFINNSEIYFKSYYHNNLKPYLVENFYPSTEEVYLEYIKTLEK